MFDMASIMRLFSVLGLLFPAIVSGLINPIIPGFNPDPSIIRVEDDYFLVTSTFEFFPGVPVYHSKDLVKWDVIGHALSRPSQLPLRGTAPSGGVFAPTIRYSNGTFYMTTTIFDVIDPPDEATRMPRSFYVTTTDIFDEDSWSEPIYVDQHGFDPDLFFDDDGKVYFTSTFGDWQTDHFGLFANFITEIDIETGDSLTETRLLHETTIPEELGFPLTEASHIYKINGTYHMITADSGTEENHSANNYRSDSLDGPWEHNPNNPLIWNGEDLSRDVLSTGHADMVEAPDGTWWAVFLATRPQNPTNGSGRPQLGRETFLTQVTWEDGWPIFNNNQPITQHDPSVLYDLERPSTWRDDFDGARLADKEYYYIRAPYKDFKDFNSVPGKLRLRGNVYTLSQRETPAALLRKQVDVNTTFSTELSAFDPASPRQEAGATVYLSIHYHNEIAVTRHPDTGERVLVARTRTGPEATEDTTYIENEDVAAGKSVRLYIEARSEGYRLGFATGGGGEGKGEEGEGEGEGEGEVTWVASVSNENLQRFVDGWQNFVGTHFGIYSTGSGMPILNPADFDYIQTELP